MATVSKSAPQEFKQIPKHLKRIETQFAALVKKRAELEKRKAALIRQGCEYGNLAWKKQRTSKSGNITEYPRLYYSELAVQKMQRVGKSAKIGYNYVSKDADIADIRAQQKRAVQVEQVEHEIMAIDSTVRTIAYELDSVTLIA